MRSAVRLMTFGKGTCLRGVLEVVFEFRFRHPNAQMFRQQMESDRAAQFRATLTRHRERANPTTDAEHEFEITTQRKNIFHVARNDVMPVSAVGAFNSRVFRAYCNQNSLADAGTVRGFGYSYLYILQSVELDDVEAVPLFFDDFSSEAQNAPQKIFDERRLRMLIDVLRRADLLDAALVHERQPRRKRHGFDLIMGHEQHGKSELLLQSLDLDA